MLGLNGDSIFHGWKDALLSLLGFVVTSLALVFLRPALCFR